MSASRGPLEQRRERELERLKAKLVGRRLTRTLLRELGIQPNDKGKFGKAVERILGVAPNSSPLPDLGEDGELKTTVLDEEGYFRESIRICMSGHDPLIKLTRIVLVIARDLNDARGLADREVVVDDVVLLEPTALVRHSLEADRDALRRDPHSPRTYFLESRTAGQKHSSTRAFYLKKSRVQEYVDELLRATTFREIRARLMHLPRITPARLARYSAENKGRFGQYVRDQLSPALRAGVRTGVVNARGEAKEDLLVCPDLEDPVHALRRLVYVPMEVLGRGTDPESRRIQDVIYLAPSELIVHALERDRRLVQRGRAGDALFLRRKTHHFGGARQWAWYLKGGAVQYYAALVRNQPL